MTTERFHHRVRVRFAETDAMGIVHHAAYLPYLEEARVEYLRAIGHPYAELRAEGVDLAVIEAAVQYRRPLRFDDEVDVSVDVVDATRTSFTIAYELRLDDDIAATATTRHAAVNDRGRPVRLPEWLTRMGS